MTESRMRRRGARRRNRVIIGTATGIVLALAAGSVAFAELRSTDPGYRTATAQKADVAETAALAGTVASATEADEAFQVSGTVNSVKVKLGQSVAAGETLATLDTASLEDAITAAQQAVTSAEQQLDTDLASETDTTTTSSTSSTSDEASSDTSSTASATSTVVTAAYLTTAATTAPPSPSTSSSLDSAVQAVKTAQQTLLADADKVDAAVSDSKDALTAVSATLTGLGSNADCAAFLTDTSTDATTFATAQSDLTACQAAVSAALGGSTSTGSDDSSSTAATSVTSALGQLTTDLEQVQTLQKSLSDDETALSTAIQNLQAAAQKAASSSPSTGSSAGSSTGSGGGGGSGASSESGTASAPSGAGSQGASGSGAASNGASGAGTSTGSGTSGSGSATSGSGAAGQSAAPASAAQIVADQASVASAQAELAVAQENATMATLTTPISGTVAAVSLTTGESVSAGSTTELISVIGKDGWIVDTTVGVTGITALKVGQLATATVSGVSAKLTGTVSSIGFLNSASDLSTPSYDVKIKLASSSPALLNGASAQLKVDVATVKDVLTVPSSAVHVASGNTYSVDVVADGKATPTTVKIGAAGAGLTQITSGLSAGDEVELADLSSTTTSDSTSSTTSGTRYEGGTGSFGGGAGPAGAAGTGGSGR